MTLEPELGHLKRLEDFSLHDLESVRLVLRGDSVVDWHRLNLTEVSEARALIRANELDPDDPRHRLRLESLKGSAIDYLRRQFDFPIPLPVESSSVEELMLTASGKGHRQTCACAILKAMHIINHLDGRELLFCIPMSDQDVFRLVEEKVYRVVGGMLSAGSPIVEFVGGRKNKDSLYTKLLSKADSSASQIYDKLRFRLVTRTRADILPVLHYLGEHLFPFSLVLTKESINTIFPFKQFCLDHPHLRTMVDDFQTGLDDTFTVGDNRFSSGAYRVIHFVVDLPIRLPPDIMKAAPPSAAALGPVVFVLCEFQIVDRDTEEANERGDASHDAYKERQRLSVKRRLKIGVRELKTPTPSESTTLRTSAPVEISGPKSSDRPGQRPSKRR